MALQLNNPTTNSGLSSLALNAAKAPLTFDQRGPRFPRKAATKIDIDIGAFPTQG
jgi:hypothetical protein